MGKLRITVAKIGNSAWPRFAIRDSHGRYWAGDEWSHDPEHAVLYCAEQEAAAEANLMSAFIEPRRFLATVEVRVNHDERFSYGELVELLDRSTVSLELPRHHALGDAEVEIIVNWNSLEELE